MELTPDELAEYERQRKELAHPRFHDSGKCGEKLLHRVTLKSHAKLNRLYCPVHHLYVDMSGWEIGMAYGDESKNYIGNPQKK